MTDFEHIVAPYTFEEYYTKYPEGYTIYEALLDWTKTVNLMIDDLNLTNAQITQLFTDTLPENVTAVLEGWLADGLIPEFSKDALGVTALETTVGALTEDRKLKFVAGAIRNTGAGWFLIDDAEHTPIGIASISNDNDRITVNYDFTASKVISLTVTPDEIMARNGVSVGSSVGSSLSYIEAYKHFFVNAYVVKSGGDTPVYTLDTAISKGITSVESFDFGKVLKIFHEPYDLPNYTTGTVHSKDMDSGDIDIVPNISSYGLDETRVTFKRKPKTLGGLFQYVGSAFEILYDFGITSAVWDAASTSLKIIFSSTFKNNLPSVSIKTNTSLTPKIYSYSEDTIQVRFYDASDVLVTTPSVEMKCIVMANESVGINVIPDDGPYIFEKSGFSKMNPNDLTYTGGNLWIFGIMEVA